MNALEMSQLCDGDDRLVGYSSSDVGGSRTVDVESMCPRMIAWRWQSSMARGLLKLSIPCTGHRTDVSSNTMSVALARSKLVGEEVDASCRSP